MRKIRSFRFARDSIQGGGGHGAPSLAPLNGNERRAGIGNQRLFRFRRADKADRHSNDAGRPRKNFVEHIEQTIQGGRRVADGGDCTVESVAPKLKRGGAARGAEFSRERWHGGGV